MLFGVGTHSKGDPNIAHFTFTQKSKCGGKSLSVSLQSSKHPKKYPCSKKVSDLACSKKREKKERKRKKGEREKKEEKKEERERKEKERKEDGKSEGEPWLHTLKQLMHTNNQEPCSSSFRSLRYST